MGLDEILGLLPFLLVHGVDERLAGQYWLLFELGFWAFVAVLTLLLLRLRPGAFARAELILRRVSAHERFWITGFAVAVFLARLTLLPLIPVPTPNVHDEFSYLVASDTFAHGRLTNPSTPMWQHFESFHINMHPTYQSMYPPAQGMALAIGQKLTGVPWGGVLLSTALMCGAIYWMLLGWLPAPWAWLGGAFSVLRFGIVSYWTNSYMGGSVAALGGALLLGALPRLKRETKLTSGVAFAAGLLILANSRPLEGLIFSSPIVLAVVWHYVKRDGAWKTASKKLLPAVLLLILGLVWIPYYNWRGTGNPLLMPYMLNFQEYHITKPYLFQRPNAIPEYRHQAIRNIYVFHEYPDVVRPRIEGIGYMFSRTATHYYLFYVFPFLLLMAAALPVALHDPSLRLVLTSVGLLATNMFLERWKPEAHYAAPATAAFILFLLFSLRHFRNSHRSWGRPASQAIVITFGLLMLSSIANRIRDPYFLSQPGRTPEAAKFIDGRGMPPQFELERIKADLNQRPGKHLVIVHHGYRDIPTTDWIYNEADMDHAHVLWARDMGYTKNRELINYYSDRQVWYVDREDPVARLVPYDQAIISWRLLLSGLDNDFSPTLQSALRYPAATETRPVNTHVPEIASSGVTSRTASQHAKAASNAQSQ